MIKFYSLWPFSIFCRKIARSNQKLEFHSQLVVNKAEQIGMGVRFASAQVVSPCARFADSANCSSYSKSWPYYQRRAKRKPMSRRAYFNSFGIHLDLLQESEHLARM